MDYTIFGKIYHCAKAVAFPMKDIKDRSLRELYELFETIDNAHTDEETVVVHFLYDATNKRVDMAWTCSHYEAQTIEDIGALLHFLLELRSDMNVESFIDVDLLDAFAEKLIILVSDVPFHFPKTAKNIKNLAVDYGEQ